MNNKCQVFTPENIANQMLDLAHYRSKLYGKRVLESACGEGNLLACVIKRYILDCLNHQLPVQTVKKDWNAIFGVMISTRNVAMLAAQNYLKLQNNFGSLMYNGMFIMLIRSIFVQP